MKTVIVYSHPYNKSYCQALLESAKQGAIKAGKEVDVIDLYADNFNPVMTAEDLKGFVKHEMVDYLAKDYFNRIKTADHLVLIFPIWWELMPAIMKGFIDKVVFPGSFYEYSKNGMITLLPNLKVTIITTMNTPALTYKFVFKNAIQKALVKGTFNKIGIKKVKWISLNEIKATTNQKRQNWLEKIEKHMAK